MSGARGLGGATVACAAHRAMSGARGLGGATVACAALVAAPAWAQQEAPGEDALRESVRTLEVESSINTIELEDSVEALEAETRRGRRVTVTVSADVLFEFDRARLTPNADTTVERLARRIRSARGPVRVDGHTDSVGSAAYNRGLSRRRAASVSQALAAALGAGVSIRARGLGESRPVAPNTQGGEDNPAGRARNRRVTVTFRRR
jgi:outer membrane protein OmpA-like peptidoglycan-associated protein